MSKEKTAVKITMGERVVIMRMPSNGDIENAMTLTSKQVGDEASKYLFMFKMQDNLVKELLHSIDGNTDVRKPLGDMFSMAEIIYLKKKAGEMSGMGNEMAALEEVITL